MSTSIPCIKYKTEVNLATVTSVNIDITVNNFTHSKKIPIFTSKMGIEGLFYVIDKYKEYSTALNFQVADKWSNFNEVLDMVAESKWDTQISGITAQAQTNNRFKEKLDKFVHSYTRVTHLRVVLIK